MPLTAEKRAARRVANENQIPYTMALRLVREAKESNPDLNWTEAADQVLSEE